MKTFLILWLALCGLAVVVPAQESVPSIRILPGDVVQISIKELRFPVGTNKFTVMWQYTETGAKKMLAFWRAHAGGKVVEQVGEFEFPATLSVAKPPDWTEEDWLKYRTDKFIAVSEADAKKIVAGLKDK
jgi:hypothetical protein